VGGGVGGGVATGSGRGGGELGGGAAAGGHATSTSIAITLVAKFRVTTVPIVHFAGGR